MKVNSASATRPAASSFGAGTRTAGVRSDEEERRATGGGEEPFSKTTDPASCSSDRSWTRQASVRPQKQSRKDESRAPGYFPTQVSKLPTTRFRTDSKSGAGNSGSGAGTGKNSLLLSLLLLLLQLRALNARQLSSLNPRRGLQWIGLDGGAAGHVDSGSGEHVPAHNRRTYAVLRTRRRSVQPINGGTQGVVSRQHHAQDGRGTLQQPTRGQRHERAPPLPDQPRAPQAHSSPTKGIFGSQTKLGVGGAAGLSVEPNLKKGAKVLEGSSLHDICSNNTSC
eukprot:Hpha_TRINITY_DN16700_c1_g2::TRINITY_DN16700_c1_g2_i1::g.79147::m.79147